MFKKSFYYLFSVIIISSCSKSSSHKSDSNASFRYIDKITISNDKLVDGAIVGGLSSIDYISGSKFIVISDDRSEYSPARAYEMEIAVSHEEIEDCSFKKTILLEDRNGDPFKVNEIDPESIRYRASTDSYFYTSEGGRTEQWVNPFIWEISREGTVLNTVNVPEIFKFNDEKGVRENGGFESLTFENDTIIWYANELPLKEDGEVPGYEEGKYPVRLVRQDIKNDIILNQYAYNISSLIERPNPEDGFFINSVPEILYIDENRLWVLERSYTKGVGNFVRLFEVETTDATDIKNIESLYEEIYTSVSKILILDFSDFNQKIDNIEGMTFGPELPDGSKSFLFISDDNFNDEQETQLWLFSVKGLH